MKIALVSPYDFAYPGGVVHHISALGSHFTGMGHEVKIIAPASKAVAQIGDRFIPIGKPRSVPTSGSIARITLSLWLASRIASRRPASSVCGSPIRIASPLRLPRPTRPRS